MSAAGALRKQLREDWQSGLRRKVMVIEVEALLLVGRDMGTDSHGDSLQLLPW